MNNNIRLGLLAVSTIAVLSLAACKTTDEATQDSTPPPADTSATPPTTP